MTKFKVGNICRIVGCIKMGKNKSRTAVNRKVNKLLTESPNECEWWDGGHPECMLPWSHKGCNGNPFVCRKFYYKYLASATKPLQDIINEFDKRQISNKDN